MFDDNECIPAPLPGCVIIEQPAPKALRFRYNCESRSAGSLPGINSTPESKTFPTIQIPHCPRVRAVVVVSCVTRNPPYRAHPNMLVGRGAKKGVCRVEVPRNTLTVEFSHLGIQYVKRKDIQTALREREQMRVDPFRNGFDHKYQSSSIDLKAVRLCFQVFMQRKDGENFTELAPVVSDPIFDKKNLTGLQIFKLSDYDCPVDGGNKIIILLCGKVVKDDIQIRFYEEKDGQIVWEGFGKFKPDQVHKQTAIWFRPPKYHTQYIQEPIHVNLQLRRPSDDVTSAPVPFQLLPLQTGIKRPRFQSDQVLNKKFKDIQGVHKNMPNEFQFQVNLETNPRIEGEPTSQNRVPPNRQWNIPFTSYAAPSTSLRNDPTEIKQIIINSGDLPSTNSLDVNSLAECLSMSLSLSDILKHENDLTHKNILAC